MVLTRPRYVPRPASAAFQRPVPDLGPVLHSFHPGLQDDEASTKGSLSFARPSFSSPVAPGKERGPFGLNPGLRTPQLPATHAKEETGHRARAGDHVIINGTSSAVIHSPHATSCRTRSVLPSAATTRRCPDSGPAAGSTCAAAFRRESTQPVNAACSATGSSRDSSRRKVLACGGSAQTRTSGSATAAQSAIAAYERAPARTALSARKKTDCRL